MNAPEFERLEATLLDDASAVSLDDQIAALQREFKRRADWYPQAVGRGQMKAATARTEITALVACLRTLRALRRTRAAKSFAAGHDLWKGAPS